MERRDHEIFLAKVRLEKLKFNQEELQTTYDQRQKKIEEMINAKKLRKLEAIERIVQFKAAVIIQVGFACTIFFVCLYLLEVPML